MANTLSVVAVNREFVSKSIRYKVALSGSYVQAVRGTLTGELLTLSSASGKLTEGQYFGYEGASVNSARCINVPNGYPTKIIPSTDTNHFLMQIFSAPATELAAGPYPAGILADLDIVVEFQGLTFR